ncbi:MAG: hypothetical protein OXL34_13800 [Gemmatimonadota bacterium]|nr:hypothetical protein [Gemmatimonadota bacterium]
MSPWRLWSSTEPSPLRREEEVVMPFNLGIMEIGMIVMVLGAIAVVGVGAFKLIDRGTVGRREELEAEKRHLERRIEALEKREQLPKG